MGFTAERVRQGGKVVKLFSQNFFPSLGFGVEGSPWPAPPPPPGVPAQAGAANGRGGGQGEVGRAVITTHSILVIHTGRGPTSMGYRPDDVRRLDLTTVEVEPT